jgi:AcrR family transcriptional regulator
LSTSPAKAVSPRRKYSPRLPREERRQQLLDATLELIAARGFGAVSMEAVAREADIAKTVVYDAFANQEELLRALFEREQERALSAIAAAMPSPPIADDPLEVLVESLTKMLEAIRRDPATWRLILLPADGAPPSLRAVVERHRAVLLRQLEPIVAWGLRERGLERLDPELTAHTIVGLAEHAARLTLMQPRRFTPQRLADFAAELLAAVAAARPAPRKP